MPRYYCDYCDTYLTHDSPSVRKQHNSGYKHKANIRSYYQKFEEQQTQILLDQKIKQHLGQTAAYQQIGSAYNQHLAAFPGGRPPMPLMPPPMMPVPGGVPHHMAPGFRPPVLPIPVPGVPGYGPPSMATSGMMQQPPGSTMPPPPGSTMLPPPPATSLPPSTQSHEMNPSGTSAATIGSYSYAQPS